MKLTIRCRQLLLDHQNNAEIRSRVLHVFSRIQQFIRDIDLTIADINGPKGGLDKLCRLRVRGRSLPNIFIEHVGIDAMLTIAVAAERAQQVVLRKIARRRRFVPATAL